MESKLREDAFKKWSEDLAKSFQKDIEKYIPRYEDIKNPPKKRKKRK